MENVTLIYDHGTLVVPHLPVTHSHPVLKQDARTNVWRAPGHSYRSLVEYWHRQNLVYDDQARSFGPMEMVDEETFSPYPHQHAALEAWKLQGRRGVVVLPTGAGKTFLAVLAIRNVRRPTLVIVPTIDLLQQWHKVLAEHLRMNIGMLGGGTREPASVMVTTYDSAAQQSEFLGNRFGLLVFDECHHLPSASYRFIASGNLAPYRLGLTATLERVDGGHVLVQTLLGNVCHRTQAHELQGTYLAPYDIRRIDVPMSAEEKQTYDSERRLYLAFLRSARVNLSSPNGWGQFVMRASQSEEGRRAMQAYRSQRRVALTCDAKVDALWEIFMAHRHCRCIIFTDDNDTVYRLSRLFMIPAITHHTGPKERQDILGQLAAGTYMAVITSRVLNEGVDVPDANVGVVLSGSGSVREHVQRLGRILRKRPGKRAILYEICSVSDAEQGISERRRQHVAYGGQC